MRRRNEINGSGLYIEPSTWCPLDCQLCYTAHRQRRLLPRAAISRAVELMLEGQDSLGLFWCGLGEVFEDERFVGLLQELDERYEGRLLHLIQTNGQTGGRLPLRGPENKLLLISLDLPRAFNDWQRGPDCWEPALACGAAALAQGVLGLGVKCLLSASSLPQVAPAFEELLRHWSAASGLDLDQVRQRVRLEPIIPFHRQQVARIERSSFAPGGGTEDRQALLELAAQHLPQHLEDLRDRPRTVQASLTVDGLFSCCEAVERIGAIEDLWRLDRTGVLTKLAAAAPRCQRCPLASIC